MGSDQFDLSEPGQEQEKRKGKKAEKQKREREQNQGRFTTEGEFSGVPSSLPTVP